MRKRMTFCDRRAFCSEDLLHAVESFMLIFEHHIQDVELVTNVLDLNEEVHLPLNIVVLGCYPTRPHRPQIPLEFFKQECGLMILG